MGLENWAEVRLDVMAFAASIAILTAYHLLIRFQASRDPSCTVQSVMSLARSAWTRSIMMSGKDVLAVQTLRNSTMAATFLASTAVLLIIGVLTLSGQGEKLGATWRVGEALAAGNQSIWQFKLVLLLVDLFIAFFSFMVSVRLFNHVGYLINVPLGGGRRAISPERVAAHLNQAGRFYTTGMRTYYFLVPLVLWLFGPYFLVAGSAALVFGLYKVDHIQEESEETGRFPEAAPRLDGTHDLPKAA